MWLTFQQWWKHEGSGILPKRTDDMETHAKATAMAAWSEARKNAKMICVNCGEQMFRSESLYCETVCHECGMIYRWPRAGPANAQTQARA